MSKVQVDTIDTRSGTSTMQIGSTNTSTINIGVSGDTVNIPSGVTIANAGTATGFGSNTPNFYAYCNDGSAAFNNSTDTTVVLNAELFDSDSKFDTSTYRFTPGVAGTYFLYGQVRMNTTQAATILQSVIRKNGTAMAYGRASVEQQGGSIVSGLFEANTTDYFDLMAFQNTGFNHNFNALSTTTYFTGFRLL